MSKNFLIVKTSAIGDVVQSFPVLEYLKERFPSCNIDWVVSPASFSLISSHPLVRKAILFDVDRSCLKHWEIFKIKRFYKALRENYYDALFDLQGNTKSGLITSCSRSKDKVGFGSKKVAEWPNLLFTDFQYDVESCINIREQYLELVKKYFKDERPFFPKTRLLNIDHIEKKKIKLLLNDIDKFDKKVLVCPSSKWKSKELNINILKDFLSEVDQNLKVFYFFLWGDEKERVSADFLHNFFVNSIVLDRMDLSTLQNFISQIDCVIAMDSCPLHLGGSIDTPTFSFFGPTSSAIYKPLGEMHFSFQGQCHLNKKFEKRCPLLRCCSNPKCMDNVEIKKLTEKFLDFVRLKLR